MISNQLWVGAVDHRISAAIVFFVLMLLLNTGKRRSLFPLRAGAALAVMCLCSWLLRTMSDEWITNMTCGNKIARNHSKHVFWT